MRILLVEDERDLAVTIKEQLEQVCPVDLAFTGQDGEYLVRVNDYDLIILDVGLPDISGIEVCKRIRKHNTHSSILMLTGHDGIQKKVLALDCGADDYVIKPFSIDELKARIRALLRRKERSMSSHLLKIDDLILNAQSKIVTRGNVVIPLRRKEFLLLEFLLRNRGKVITREMILDHVWEDTEEPLTNTIDVHIKYLRDQIDKPFSKKLIRTIHGLGYKIDL